MLARRAAVSLQAFGPQSKVKQRGSRHKIGLRPSRSAHDAAACPQFQTQFGNDRIIEMCIQPVGEFTADLANQTQVMSFCLVNQLELVSGFNPIGEIRSV